MTQEIRLSESASRTKHWNGWGPYLRERAWGTVPEEYSPYGNAWEFFPLDHARSRVHRWNEDGAFRICCPIQRALGFRYVEAQNLAPLVVYDEEAVQYANVIGTVKKSIAATA